MGKGGVGKTTIAAAIAVELASRGLPVHLSTTDPAAHVASTLVGEVPNLKVSRIDPAAETKAYVDNVMATRGAKLDDAGPRAARRGSALAVLRGGGRLRRVLAPGPRGAARASSSSTPRPPGTRCCCSTRPARITADRRAPTRPSTRDGSTTPLMRLGNPELHEGPARHARRDHAGVRGGAAPGRSASRGDRAVRVGHQQQPRRGRLHRSAAPAADRGRADADRGRPDPARQAGRRSSRGSSRSRSARSACAGSPRRRRACSRRRASPAWGPGPQLVVESLSGGGAVDDGS